MVKWLKIRLFVMTPTLCHCNQQRPDKSLNCLFLLPKNKQDERRNVVMGDYTILHYEIYEYPQCPTDNGRYYGKTPLLEQEETVIKNAKESGKMLF